MLVWSLNVGFRFSKSIRFDLLLSSNFKDIPHNLWNSVCTDKVTVHSTEPRTQFDVACVTLPKVDGNLGVIIEEGRRNVRVFRVAIHVQVKWIGVVSGQALVTGR